MNKSQFEGVGWSPLASAARIRGAGYLYEVPLLVLAVTLLAVLSWPALEGPWRVAVGLLAAGAVLVFLWYGRGR